MQAGYRSASATVRQVARRLIHVLSGGGVAGGQEIFTLWGKGIQQYAGFEADAAMYYIGRFVQRIARTHFPRLTIDGKGETAAQHLG